MKKTGVAVLAVLLLAQAPAFAATDGRIGTTSSGQAGVSLVIPARYNASFDNGALCLEPMISDTYRIVDSEGTVISESCPGGGVKINAGQAAAGVLLIEAE